MKFSSFAFLFLLFVSELVLTQAEDVLVTVEQGTLLGNTATSVYNTSYTAFRGIPYAEPPVGELRFLAPQPASGWENVYNATQYSNDCIQDDGSGSEDCLYLNVYVPGVPEEGAGLPVMFWVYGGGFTEGSGSDQDYGPDFLVSYGVILVTINYRLGPLGFLSTGDELVPGNAAMKDQQLALSWVQTNIAKFGGDPSLVTLFGQSAGGISVSFHLVSPLSAGLFSRVIIESGVFIRRLVPLASARNHAFRLGSLLGFETEDSRELLDFLRSVNATDLLVDRSLILTDEFINDVSIFEPTDALVRKATEVSSSPVYYYVFDYGREEESASEWGVLHSGEIPFLFLKRDTEYNLDPESEEEQVRRNLLRLWTNFAKYGNPTPEADPVLWEPYDSTNRSYFLMQANFTLARDKLSERMTFWRENVPLLPYPDTF